MTYNCNKIWITSSYFLPEASFGLRVLSLPACVCVSVCVRVSVNHELVRAIIHQPFKLGSPNLDQRYKRPWLRPLSFCGVIDGDLEGQIELESQNLPHLDLWVCPGDKSIPNKARLSKFRPKMHLSTVKVPIDFGIDWSWSSVSFLTSNLLYSTKFCVS